MIQKKLIKKGIDTRNFFWPMHKQKIYKKMKLFLNQKYPVAEYLANNGFYLPSGLALKNYQIDYICKIINKLIK